MANNLEYWVEDLGRTSVEIGLFADVEEDPLKVYVPLIGGTVLVGQSALEAAGIAVKPGAEFFARLTNKPAGTPSLSEFTPRGVQ